MSADFGEKGAYTRALIRSLRQAGVKFLRYHAIDTCHTSRVKVVPLDFLQRSCDLDNQVSMAEVVFGGMPPFGDYIQEASGFDASNLLCLRPDLRSLRILPYAPLSALVLCNLHNPINNEPSGLCCRSLLQQVVANAQSESNLAFSVGSELEFTLFDAQTRQPVDKTNFCESRTLNQREQFLSSLYDQLQLQEIEVEQLHAESAPGQVEIVLRYCQDPVELADRLVLARETISQLARSHGMLAIFLPKIFPTKAGNGNHLHISVREASTGTNLFSPTPGSASTSDTTLPPPLVRKSADDIHPVVQSFLEGILCHLPTLLALTLPTANSFRRVGPGCWTGSTLSWAFNDKESPLRIVPNLERGIWDHVEYKLMDSLANPYLALAAILIAGLDGVTQEYQLRPPSGGPKGADAPSATDLPQSIGTSLDQLEANRLFQERLSRPLLRAYVACRRAECQDDQDKTLDDEVRRALQLAL